MRGEKKRQLQDQPAPFSPSLGSSIGIKISQFFPLKDDM